MQKFALAYSASELWRAKINKQYRPPLSPEKRVLSPLAIGRSANFSRLMVVAVTAVAMALVSVPSYADDVQMPPVEPATEAGAASADAFKAGDIAVSSFGGTKLIVQSLPPGVDPVSKSFLDPDGVVLRVYSLGNLPGPAAGQNIGTQPIFEGKARDIGHVFALAFENLGDEKSTGPALFAAASSAFGLQIIAPNADGSGPSRIWKGAPGATFMPGQFGGLPNAGPGTIFKIDRATGDIRVFSNVTTSGTANSGPGIGGLAFDPASKTLYASDLETGLIHAFAANGSDIAQFDHGIDGRPLGKKGAVADNGKRANITSPEFVVSDPSTWGFTQPERRIDALAVHDGRLYYAAADGPEIWSIGLDTSGTFSKDPRFELRPNTAKPFPVTAVAFDQAGHMILAQRGTLDNPADYSQMTRKGPSQILRYTPEAPDDPNTPERWKPAPQEYAVGDLEDFRAASGGLGIQYAYKEDGSADPATCGGTLVVSGDTLGADRKATGLQLGSIELVKPANIPPVKNYVIDLDPKQNDPAARGHSGGVAVLQDCGGAGGAYPPVAQAGSGGAFPGVAPGDADNGFPGVAGGDAGGGGDAFPPVNDTQEGGGTTDDNKGGGGTTTNGALTMTKSPGSATCAENQPCSFKITVTNNSDKPADKVVFNDDTTIGGAPFTKFKLSDVSAPWKCQASTAPGMQCTNPNPLQPKASTDLTLTFTPEPGSLAGATELKNCVSFPAGANQQGDAAQQPLVPPPAPTGTNNGGLKVETLGTSPSCSAATGNCEFEIKITNQTGQPIQNQPLKIFDTLSVGTQSQAKNNATSMQLPPGLQCKPEGREFNCSQDQLTLPANGSVTMKVAFSVDTTEGGEADFVQNKTAVTLGPLTGEATAAIALLDDAKLPEPGANDQQAGAGGAPTPACATIPVAPSGAIVVNKKGPAKCALKGPCAFTIDVTNSFDAAVQGPIEIVDTVDLPTAKISGAVPAPFECDAGGPPFKCRLNGTLQPKETKTLALTLDLDAPAGTKSLKNCAVPTQPQGAAPQQGQGQQQKQFAPGKKSDLFPFGWKSVFGLASFRPQSFAQSPLVHLAGEAGGNIGGVGPNNCLKWGMPRDGFNVIQSNGPQVGFGDMKVGADGNAIGTASFITNEGPVTGTVSGTIIGTHVDLTVHWKNANVKSGHYVGEIAPDGNFSGTNRASNGVTATFKSSKIWFKCSVDDLCKKYADDAMTAETEFESLHCGAVGSGRWSNKIDDHINWCMSQSRGGDSPIQGETDARTNELNACREFDARCTKAGLAVAAKNDEMKALNCKDAIPSLQPDKAKSACKIAAIKFSPESLIQSAQQKLDACKLVKLNGADGAGGAADPGGAAGGAGDPGAGGAADPGGANGQGGDQAQPPASNQCVVVALEDQPPPAQAGKLALSKNPAAGKCTSTGGGCDFVISVFNPDPAVEFNGPVSFTDHISQPDGTPFPNVTVQTPINPQADPGITGGNLGCKKDGNDVNCSSFGASLKIPPGKKIVIPMSFTPGGDTVAKAVKNCASLPGGEQQCATIPFAENGPLLRAKKIAVGKPETCMPNCEFLIQLSNVGTSDAQGPFVLKDVFKAANGFDSFRMVGDSAFACTSTNGTIGCISTNKGTNKLAPGETISGAMLFNVSAVSPEYSNCVAYDPAVQAKPSPFDLDAGPLCATIKDTAHDRANIAIRLTAPNEGPDGVGKCELNSPCRFMARIDSNGVNPYLSNPAFNATMSPNRVSQLGADATASKQWNCFQTDPGLRLLCKNEGVASLTTPQFVTQEVTVVAGPGWTKNSTMTMCVTLTGAVNTFDNFHGDNTACKSVILDPFNVKVSKTGDQSCAPGGDCHFTINLFNPGPIDHNAPVTITDHLKGLSSASIVSIVPPLPCASQPTQIPFSCTSPGPVCLNMDGKPGETCGPQSFEMIVRLPNNDAATQFANCASVTSGEKGRIDEESCHPVSLKPLSKNVSPPIVIPSPRECLGGMVKVGDLCACPPGTRFNGRTCLSDEGTGGAYPTYPNVQTAPPACPSYRPVGNFPNCCPLGTEFRAGVCRRRPVETSPSREPSPPPRCPAYRPVGVYPNCCPIGMEYRFGSCRALRGPDGSGGSNGTAPNRDQLPPKCPSYRPVGTFPNCCPIGMEYRFGSCRRSREPDGSGGSNGTAPNRGEPPKCPLYRPVGEYPNCCPLGTEFRMGSCRRPSRTDGSGGTNGTQRQDQDRKCPPGYHRLRRPNKYGAYCEPDQQQGPAKCPANRPNGTPPNCCPPGTAFRLGQCYPEKCSPGWIGVPPRCRPPQTNPTPNTPNNPVPQKPRCTGGKVNRVPDGLCVCPGGTREQNGRCVERGPA